MIKDFSYANSAIFTNNLILIIMNAHDKDKDMYGDLPKAVVQCLKLCGFDSDTALSALKDISEIETFLREHGDFFKSSAEEEAKCAYGIFFNATDKFKFLPGHKISLEAFLKKRNANDEININSEAGKKLSSDLLGASKSASREGNVSQEEVLKAWKSIKKNLTNWCKKQDSPLKELQEDIHYTITVTPIKCEIKCLVCRKVCQTGKAKGQYLISNYTRHMLKSCTYLKKKQTNLKQLSLTNYRLPSTSTSNAEEIESIISPEVSPIANDEEMQTITVQVLNCNSDSSNQDF